MVVVAIDIGLTGAIAAVGHASWKVGDLAARRAEGPNKAGRQRLDGRQLHDQIVALVPAEDRAKDALLVFEDVQARPQGNAGAHGNSIHSQGSLMRSRGIVEGVADCLGMKVQVVQPQSWKRAMNLQGKDKEAARELAIRMFPGSAALLARVKDHNRAEALLIAQYARGKFA